MSPQGFFNQPVFIDTGNPDTMNSPTLAYPGQLGTRFSYTEPPRAVPSETVFTTDAGWPKTYKLVQTDSGMAVAPYQGAVAWYLDQAKYVVTTSPTGLGRGRLAGVFKNSVTPGNFCCIQVKGKCLVKFVDAPVATPDQTGLFVIPSATAAKADCLAAGSAPTYPYLGRSAGVYQGAVTLGLVDLDVPEVL